MSRVVIDSEIPHSTFQSLRTDEFSPNSLSLRSRTSERCHYLTSNAVLVTHRFSFLLSQMHFQYISQSVSVLQVLG